MRFKGALSLSEVQLNDRIKVSLAIENGIEKVIHIDCSGRDLFTLKNNIIDSLKNVLDVSKVKWDICFQNACKSKIFEVCQKWEEVKEYMDANELSKQLNMKRDTVVRYLHKGTEAGFCVYDGEKERRKASLKGVEALKPKRKKILVFDKNDIFLGEYKSARELINKAQSVFNVEFKYYGIFAVCNGSQKTHKGYKFKYKND